MPQFTSVSRAARLVGVKRATLQQQIRDGELTTFEGQIDLSELLRVYPQTKVEDSAMIERADHLIEHARSRRGLDQLPDAEVLAMRVTALSHELGTANYWVHRYDILLQQLQDYLRKFATADAGPTRDDIEELRDWLDSNLSNLTRGIDDEGELYATDTLLRVMAAQVHVQPSGHEFLVQGNDNLLDAGLHAGLALDYGCSDGSCGRCRARLTNGTLKLVRRQRYHFSEAERKAGDIILMCCNTAVTDVRLEVTETTDPASIETQRLSTQVAAMERVENDVMLLSLRLVEGARLRFLAGQSAWLVNGDLRACYPIASCPCDEHVLEFHIRMRGDDAFTRQLLEGVELHQTMMIEGPSGDFVVDNDSLRSIVFIAWDIGFAPIKSMIGQALALDTAEALYLFRVHSRGEQPYMHNRGRAWADALDNFHYTHWRAETPAPSDNNEARVLPAGLLTAIAAPHYDVATLDFYIAAPATELDAIRRHLIARGVPAAQIRGLVSGG
ncbi:MAG: 2Fe-2S iron-sulfur cluster binding domain-containing protein [Gammaproteobacteria bacterium]|nr:2Fe-2S iron-sulfur cluster binding domain-containing protein [Gammaproteobacteria bacterium]